MHGLEDAKEVYVAHIDILGMSSVLRHSNDRAWVILNDLADAAETEELPIQDTLREAMSERYFSDTIVICTENETTELLYTIIARVFEIFRCAFRLAVPLRAGIAHGTWIESQSRNQELFTGDALQKAYDIGETQQLIGVSLCDAISQRLMKKPFSMRYFTPVVNDYPVPVKGGGIENRTMLNWHAFCTQELDKITPLSEEMLVNYFDEFGRYETLGESEKTKYSNTVDFVKSMGRQ